MAVTKEDTSPAIAERAEPGHGRARATAGRDGQRQWRRRRAYLGALLFVVPYALIFLAFRMVPSLGGMILGFTEYSTTGAIEFVGLENFRRLVADSVFWNALRVTLIYASIAVPLVVAVSLLMAHLAARSVRGIKVYRALFFLPVITSLVATAVIWKWLYSSAGPFNWLLGSVGIEPLPWISSGIGVLPSIAIVAVWTRFGFDMLILLAGMLAIPKDYYEAASLDGANTWQQFKYVTLPGLRRPLFFVVILEIVMSFQVFDLVYVMTGGGPVRSSYTLVFMVYDQGFRSFDFGYASAAGMALFVIVLVTSLIQRRLFRDGE